MGKQFQNKLTKKDQNEDYEILDQELEMMNDKEEFKVRSQKSDFRGLTEGQWTKEENLKYVVFMDRFETIFNSKQKRKVTRIFRTLSDYIKSRNPSQCRSHFQKLMNRFKKLKKIFNFYREQAGIQVYQQYYNRVSNDFKGLVTTTIKQEDSTSRDENKYVEQSVQTDQQMFISYNQVPNFYPFSPQIKCQQTTDNLNNYMGFMEFLKTFQLQ